MGRRSEGLIKTRKDKKSTRSVPGLFCESNVLNGLDYIVWKEERAERRQNTAEGTLEDFRTCVDKDIHFVGQWLVI
jgi:hypothetical protein